ncbi:MAG: hypothetical protein QXP91_11005 [Candidatus Methanomethylicia archaeon]
MTLIELLRVIFGITIINFLPGYMFSRKVFPESDFTLRLTSSIILSMIITSIPPLILTSYLGLSWIISLYLTLTVTTIVSIYYLLKDKSKKPIFSWEYILTLFLMLLAMFRYYLPYIMLNSSMPFGQDSIFHCRDIRNIIDGVAIPPSIYPKTFHFMMAANVVVTNLPSPSVFMLITPFILVLIALEVYIFVRKIFGLQAGVLSFFTLTFLTVQPFQTLADGSIPELFGYAVSMLGFIKLLEFFRDKSVKSIAYTSILFASSLYIHATSLLLLLSLISMVFILAIPLISQSKDTKLVLGVLTIFSIAILLSIPASATYITNVVASLTGGESMLPVGADDKPSFPRDFEAFLGDVLLYSGIVSTVILPFIARRRELIIIYSVLISQVAIIEFPWTPFSFRILRQLSIPLSILIGVFVYFTPKIIFYIGVFTTIISSLSSRTRVKLVLRVRYSVLFYIVLLIILSFLPSTTDFSWRCLPYQVIESSKNLGANSLWYVHEDVSSYQLFNNLPNGVILTDFSCGWLPYFVRNDMIIIPPRSFWKIYSFNDWRMFNELLTVQEKTNLTKAMSVYATLSKYNVSYIFLGSNPEGRHWVPSSYSETRREIEDLIKLLSSESLLKIVFNGSAKIYKLEYVKM